MYNPKIIQNFIVIVKFFIDIPVEMIILTKDKSRDPDGRLSKDSSFFTEVERDSCSVHCAPGLGVFAAISAERHEESVFVRSR